MEPSRDLDDDMRPEYDLSQLRSAGRGKYADRKRVEQIANWYEQTAGFLAGGPSVEPTPELREFLARVGKEMEPILSRSVLPIVVSANGQVGVIGTGTLFRVADVSFLVTASHVLTKAKKLGGDLYISDYSDHAPHGPQLHLHETADLYPDLDVTVWRLSQDVVAAMPNRKFLTVHHADRDNRRPRKGIYLIHGYPECWSAADTELRELTLQPFTAFCGVYQGDTNHLLNYDPDFHILLGTPRDGAFPVAGPDATTPDRFHGLSGCSIWQVLYEGLNPRHWTPDDAAVVAVQTGVYNGTITKGTRWWVVDEIIRRDYPELAGPLSLVVP